VVDTEVTVFAYAFCVEESITVLTIVGLLDPALVVVAVLAHSIGVVALVGVGAF